MSDTSLEFTEDLNFFSATVDTETEVSSQVRPSNMRSHLSENMPKLDFRSQVAFELSTVPQVQAVFASQYGKMLFVWAVVPERDKDVYHSIHQVEKTLIEANNYIQFDFTILPSGGKDPKHVISDPSANLIYARE